MAQSLNPSLIYESIPYLRLHPQTPATLYAMTKFPLKSPLQVCLTLAGLLGLGVALSGLIHASATSLGAGVISTLNPIPPSLAQSRPQRPPLIFKPRPKPTPKPTSQPTPPATAPASPTATPAPLSAEASAILQAHNQTRSQLGLPPLQWSPELANYAQTWAKDLVASNRFDHRPQSPYGENLFWGSGKRWSPQDVVKSWADEARFYDYASNTCQRGKVCGHYTQIIWRKTTQVGCGVARDTRQEIWVCNYNPPGNFIGQKPY